MLNLGIFSTERINPRGLRGRSAKSAIALNVSQHIACIRANDEAALGDGNFMTPLRSLNAPPQMQVIEGVLHIVWRAYQIQAQASAPRWALRHFQAARAVPPPRQTATATRIELSTSKGFLQNIGRMESPKAWPPCNKR